MISLIHAKRGLGYYGAYLARGFNGSVELYIAEYLVVHQLPGSDSSPISWDRSFLFW
jgi:hypothetical protein